MSKFLFLIVFVLFSAGLIFINSTEFIYKKPIKTDSEKV